jgi:hypothetical protein
VRKRERPSDGLPARLREFRIEEWREAGDDEVPESWRGPDAGMWRTLQARRRWSHARREWMQRHGNGSVIQEIIDHRRWEHGVRNRHVH